jgi:hypothetical protein
MKGIATISLLAQRYYYCKNIKHWAVIRNFDAVIMNDDGKVVFKNCTTLICRSKESVSFSPLDINAQ